MPRSHPKPWHRNANFTAPDIRPLCPSELKEIRRAIYRAYDRREPVRGGRRSHRLITPELRDAALAVVQAINGGKPIARAALAGISRAKIGMIDAALNLIDRLGVLRRHPQIARNRLGQVEQLPSAYELVPLPAAEAAPEQQVTRESVPESLSLVFAAYSAWKMARRGLGLVHRARRIFAMPADQPGSGSEDWARWNAQRQIEALLAPKSVPTG